MIILFEKTKKDAYYIKIEADFSGIIGIKDDAINGFGVNSVSLIETMTSSTPYLNFKFIDPFGDLINKYPVLPNSLFTVTYGKTREESVESKFRISNISYNMASDNDASTFIINADMIHYDWEKLFKKQLSRSWKDAKYSEVVADVVSDINFDDTDIEETNGVYNVIQPYISNAKFLKWLSLKSVNKNNVGGYVYFMTLDNRFVFNTFDKMYSNEPKKTFVHESRTFNKTDDSYYRFFVKNNYMPVLSQGGFGVTYSYFDFNKKEYVVDTKVLSDMKERQISDWYYLSKTQEEPSKQVYGARDIETENFVQNKILNTANSVQKLEINIKGDVDLHTGDIVNLIVPVSNHLKKDDVINETYSGYWLIWKKVDVFDFEADAYVTQLFLTRNGINGKDITDLVSTSVGKSL